MLSRVASRPGLALLAVLAVAAFVDLIGIHERILIVGDEALYATGAREMLERGDWVVPSFNHDATFEKPILIYWLIGASYALLGVSEGAARLPSALAGVALCGLVFALGRRLGDRTTGLAAGLVMATNVATVGISRVAMIDATLCACITGAITALVFAETARERGERGRLAILLACVAMALGTLAKGPLAALVPALVVLPWLAWRGALGSFLRRRELWLGAALACAIVAPWFVAVHVRTHGGFTRHALGYEFLGRFFGEAVTSASMPWWGYAATLWPAFFPWSLCLPSAALALAARVRAREPLVALSAWWAFVVYALFAFSSTRVVTYVLPAFPALALLVGRWWSLVLAQAKPRRSLSPLPPLLALLALPLASLALLALPDGPGDALPEMLGAPLRAALGALALGAAALCALAIWRPAREVFGASVGASALAFGAAALFLMPRIEAFEARPEKAMGEWLRAHPDVRALSLSDHAREIHFHARRRIEPFRVGERERFRAILQEDVPAAAIVRRKHRGALRGLELETLVESGGHVLVANRAWRERAARAGDAGPAAVSAAGAAASLAPAPLVLASGEASVEIDPEQFRLTLRDASGRVLARQQPSGLGFERDGIAHHARRVRARVPHAEAGALVLRIETDAGEGELTLRWRTPRALDLEWLPPAARYRTDTQAGPVTHFYDAWRLAPGETVQGLAEPPQPLSWASSAGYGLAAEAPARASFERDDAGSDALRLRFEASGAPESRSLRYSLYVGSPEAARDAQLRVPRASSGSPPTR